MLRYKTDATQWRGLGDYYSFLAERYAIITTSLTSLLQKKALMTNVLPTTRMLAEVRRAGGR